MVQGLNPGKGKRFFSFPEWPAWPVGNTQPLIQWVLRFFAGSTAAACGVNHPPLTSAKFKYEWSFT